LVYFRQEEFHSAIAPLESVVRDAPGAAQPRYLLGLCYFFSERYADAAGTLEPLWDSESNNLSYLYVVGIAAGRAKRADLESKALSRLVEVGGDTPEFHLLMGKADLNRHEPEKALAELQQAEKADSSLPFLHFNLGLAYLGTSKYDEARAEFLKDAAIEPDLAWNYDELGSLYSRQHDEAKAEQYFHEALKRDPHVASSQFGLGEIYQRQGKFSEALAALDAAEKLAPDSRNVHYVRGRILMHLGKTEEAKKEFAESQRLLDAGMARDDQIRGGMESDTRPTPNPELMKEPQ
jgi:tetratricopeptide (TPR) repeat protein